jgi:hypothetical protein
MTDLKKLHNMYDNIGWECEVGGEAAHNYSWLVVTKPVDFTTMKQGTIAFHFNDFEGNTLTETHAYVTPVKLSLQDQKQIF